MKYYIDSEEVLMSHDNLLGSGAEGRVFEQNEYAIKILHSPKYSNINEHRCKKLISISKMTVQILLPSKLVFDEHGKYSGSATISLGHENNLFNVCNLSVKSFKENYYKLMSEATLLGENQVELKDLHPINSFLKDDKIYLFDYSSYIVHSKLFKKYTDEELISYNKKEVDDLFKSLIAYRLTFDYSYNILRKIDTRDEKFFDKLFNNVDESEKIIEYFHKLV